MSTARSNHTQSRTIEREQQPANILDRAIELTSQRARSSLQAAAEYLGLPTDKVIPALHNVWKAPKDQPPLTDSEIMMGVMMIARYGMDPFAKEVYVTRSKDGRVMIIIGIDGMVKILDRTEGYDGFEQDLEWSEDGQSLDCVVTRIYTTKRSRPTIYRGFAKEYARLGGFMKDKIPWHMLRLFSLRHATRLFTPIGGSVVTEEEARWIDAYDGQDTTTRERLAEMTERIIARKAPEPQEEDQPTPPADPEPVLEPDPAEAQLAADALAFEFQEAIAAAGTEMEVVSQKDALITALKAKKITDQAYKSLDELCDVRRKEFRKANKR